MDYLVAVAEATVFDPWQFGAAGVVIIFAFYALRLLAKVVEKLIHKSNGTHANGNNGLNRAERTALRRIVPVLESLDTHLYKSEELQRQLAEELKRNREANERRLKAEEENTLRWIDLHGKSEALWDRMGILIARGIVCKYGDTVIGGD